MSYCVGQFPTVHTTHICNTLHTEVI